MEIRWRPCCINPPGCWLEATCRRRWMECWTCCARTRAIGTGYPSRPCWPSLPCWGTMIRSPASIGTSSPRYCSSHPPAPLRSQSQRAPGGGVGQHTAPHGGDHRLLQRLSRPVVVGEGERESEAVAFGRSDAAQGGPGDAGLQVVAFIGADGLEGHPGRDPRQTGRVPAKGTAADRAEVARRQSHLVIVAG